MDSRGRPALGRLLLALALTATASAASPALAKPKSGEVIGVQRRIEIPVTITKKADLDFGRLVMLGNSGSVTIRTTGLPLYSNLVALGGSPNAARFEIHGPPNRTVEILLTFPVDGRYGARGTAKLEGLSVAADYTPGFQQTASLVRIKLDSSGNNAITVAGKLSLTIASPGRTDILFPITASLAQ